MPDVHTMFLVSLQVLQIGHLVLFFLFAEHFSWSNYVSLLQKVPFTYIATACHDIMYPSYKLHTGMCL